MSGTHYYPYHFVMTNNTQEAAYLQSVSSSGSWNPPLAPEISPFDTVSATDTGPNGASGQFTIHYNSGVDFSFQFDSTVSSPTFSSSTSGNNPNNYIVDQYGPVIVGNTAKVTLSIADPRLKK